MQICADSSDIVDHKLKLILGLIWTLILHYSIALPVWDDDDDDDDDASELAADASAGDSAAAAAGRGGRGSVGSLSRQTPKQRLLAWIQNRIPDRAITNFTSDWSDGQTIGALVDAVAPGLSVCLSVCHFVCIFSSPIFASPPLTGSPRQ